MAKTGDVLGGNYVVKALLGEGGTAKVYLVADGQSGERYALKEMKGEASAAMAELRVKQKLFHPALPHVWKVWEQAGKAYVVMDYVEGESLQDVLRRGGALGEERAVDIARQLCRALIYLHGFQPPVIYRDMKPANVILQKDGKIKLVDFGAIRQLEGRGSRDRLPQGTRGYAAPEQYGSHARSDVRSDVYALGVTLYFMLTGHDPGEPPYELGSIRDWNKKLSPALEKIVRKATAKWTLLRYPDCEALLRELETYHEKDRRKG